MLRALRGLIRKEFIQVFRDRNMLRLIFAMPVIQLMLFGYVVNTEVKLLDIDIYDFDRSPDSRALIDACRPGDYFRPTTGERSILELEDRFQAGTSEFALIIPPHFAEDLTTSGRSTIGLVADGTNANSTSIGAGYLGQIVRKFSERRLGQDLPLNIRFQNYYNPEMESVYFMVPGIVAALLTMITVMLTSMAIVRERERGTLEQLVVTPITTMTLLMGKIIPFAILGLVEIIIALGLGVWWFEVPFVGSVVLLFALSLLYLLTTLGLGLFFSTVTSTQQQAMFFAWFFSVFAILTSGFFTPVANMPQWMQYVTYLNPMRYFVEIARGIMLKGSDLTDLWRHVYPLIIYGLTIFTFSAMRFGKRVR